LRKTTNNTLKAKLCTRMREYCKIKTKAMLLFFIVHTLAKLVQSRTVITALWQSVNIIHIMRNIILILSDKICMGLVCIVLSLAKYKQWCAIVYNCPPRLAPTPTPIIIIHSHTPNFVLYFLQGYVFLHTCLVFLPARYCVAPHAPIAFAAISQ